MKRSPTVLWRMVLYWLIVGVPLAWGIGRTLRSVVKLF